MKELEPPQGAQVTNVWELNLSDPSVLFIIN